MTPWNQIVREHGPPTYRTAWRILQHAQDCEDVLQEVFLEAHEKFVRGEITHPRTFLSRLVTFRAIDLLRRRRAVDSIEEASTLDQSPGPDRAVIEREEELRLRTIVADLPPRQAAVFCMAHFDELSHGEIATTLEITNGAVAMALHKARVRLRAVFAASQKESDQ